MLAKVRSAVSGRTSTEDSDNSDAAATQPPRIGMVIDMADANFIGGLIPGIFHFIFLSLRSGTYYSHRL